MKETVSFLKRLKFKVFEAIKDSETFNVTYVFSERFLGVTKKGKFKV